MQYFDTVFVGPRRVLRFTGKIGRKWTGSQHGVKTDREKVEGEQSYTITL
jgi:hypothetical protein